MRCSSKGQHAAAPYLKLLDEETLCEIVKAYFQFVQIYFSISQSTVFSVRSKYRPIFSIEIKYVCIYYVWASMFFLFLCVQILECYFSLSFYPIDFKP